MDELIEELRPVLAVLALRTKAELRVDVAPGLPELLIDRLRIQHVLFALVQNAFDASSQNADPARVKIEARSDRYAVETSVTDSGAGVPAEIRDQLFRPFFTTKAAGHRARIGLHSRDHRGSPGHDRF